jgi:hypothetical protein
MMERIADGLPRHTAKFVIAYYLLTTLTGKAVRRAGIGSLIQRLE